MSCSLLSQGFRLTGAANARSCGAGALITEFSRCQGQLTFHSGFRTDLRLYFCDLEVDWSLLTPSKFWRYAEALIGLTGISVQPLEFTGSFDQLKDLTD